MTKSAVEIKEQFESRIRELKGDIEMAKTEKVKRELGELLELNTKLYSAFFPDMD